MDDLISVLVVLAVFYVLKSIFKGLWGGWTKNDFRRDR